MRRQSSASATSSPLRKERPQSLVLEGTKLTASSPATPHTDLPPSGTPSLISLPDVPEAAVKHVSLTEQLSATSLEKLRRLKHRLHRALGSHEVVTRDSSEEAETSPLVLATPPVTSPSTLPSPMLHTPDSPNAMFNANHFSQDPYSRPHTPLLRQDALDPSPTMSQITIKSSSPSDRETPV
ncbi:uncharacterized protein LOC123502692 [Portunus trituberculatus]|uniref:uncharacterized protein LOC123502692 n=1 Tax=Portunus trituberculatus TaxID=210409 RepID=UPI001E1D1C80|nr:uncharacterized protein LOC123502692 [Portunus trituberculatus]